MALKDIKVRELNDDDMVEVSEWFVARKWPVVPSTNILPGSAYVAELNGTLLSVAWVYTTNSGLALVDWIATNPEVGTKGIISVKKLINYIDEILEQAPGITACISYTHNDKLAKYLDKKCGYKWDRSKVNLCTKQFGSHANG